MFENIGSIIKKIAIVICVPIIIKYRWAAYEANKLYGEDFSLFWYTVAGLFISFIASILIYGFGQLIENSNIIVKYYKNLEAKEKTSVPHKSELENKTESIIKLDCDNGRHANSKSTTDDKPKNYADLFNLQK